MNLMMTEELSLPLPSHVQFSVRQSAIMCATPRPSDAPLPAPSRDASQVRVVRRSRHRTGAPHRHRTSLWPKRARLLWRGDGVRHRRADLRHGRAQGQALRSRRLSEPRWRRGALSEWRVQRGGVVHLQRARLVWLGRMKGPCRMKGPAKRPLGRAGRRSRKTALAAPPLACTDCHRTVTTRCHRSRACHAHYLRDPPR